MVVIILPSSSENIHSILVRRLYNYYFSEDKELIRKVKQVLGFTPSNTHLYRIAFSHRSMNNQATQGIQINNERLEFLGDAVLSTVVAEYLFNKYPTQNEGFLTKMRSKVVKRSTLNDIADEMSLDVLLSHFIETRLSNSMKGNALEALIGAFYIENGYHKTKDFVIKKVLMQHLDFNDLEKTDDNFKSRLLEHCQKSGKKVEFVLLARFKSQNRDKFKVAVKVDGQEKGQAEDFNKKSAEQKAAKIAIKSFKEAKA